MSETPTWVLIDHPQAAAIPDMPKAQWAALLDDVREQGVLIPLTVGADGMIEVDERHRLRAAGRCERPETNKHLPDIV